MLLMTIALLMKASLAELPAETWNCRNQLEVWCSADSCAAAPPEQFTPMDIHADARGGASVCAYTGCWESDEPPSRSAGRLLWTGDDLPFSSSPDGGMNADVTLLIIEEEGVGFVRVGGFATPLLCTRRGPQAGPADAE